MVSRINVSEAAKAYREFLRYGCKALSLCTNECRYLKTRPDRVYYVVFTFKGIVIFKWKHEFILSKPTSAIVLINIMFEPMFDYVIMLMEEIQYCYRLDTCQHIVYHSLK